MSSGGLYRLKGLRWQLQTAGVPVSWLLALQRAGPAMTKDAAIATMAVAPVPGNHHRQPDQAASLRTVHGGHGLFG